MTKETRSYDAKNVRADDTNDGKIIEGHAAVFDSPTSIGGRFIEVIARDALNDCDLSDVSLLVNHDGNSLPLARTTSGTLQLTVDNIGLAIRAKLDVENNPLAKVLYSAISRGDVRGMSFAFTVADDDWQNLKSDMPTRTIRRVGKVYEVSAVNLPAYSTTDIHARAAEILAEARKEEKIMLTNYDRALLNKYGFKNEEIDEWIKRDDERTIAVNLHYSREQEFKELEERHRLTASLTASHKSQKYIPGQGFVPADEGKAKFVDVRQREKAGKDLKERRAVESPFDIFGERRTMTVQPVGDAAATIVVPDFSSPNIKSDFSVVSSLVDAVAHLSLHGGNSFTQPYITDIDTGGYSQEGEDYNQAETSFGYAQINRSKITAYAEVTEELRKLPDAAYSEVVFQNIRTSIRKVLTQEILFGAGISNNQNRIVGIFSNLATAIDTNTDISLSTIDDKTLSKIIYSYGSGEEFESPSCLILNKLDLLAFDDVRTNSGIKFYEIKYNGNGAGGSINGVPFIINSACKPLTGTSTQSGDYCMAYGNLSNYLLCEFAPLEVERSDDYKFRKGITCFRGSAIVGGNVVRRNGFSRIRKN